MAEIMANSLNRYLIVISTLWHCWTVFLVTEMDFNWIPILELPYYGTAILRYRQHPPILNLPLHT